MDTSIISYTPPESNTPINLQADFDTRTVWATQKQIADTLSLSVPTVNEHIANFKKQRGDAAKRSIRKFRIVAEDGKRREIEHHDMTVIVYVGFRAQATERVIQFQDWVGAQLDKVVVPSALTSSQALLQAVQLLVDLEQRDAQRQREIAELYEKQGEQAQSLDGLRKEFHDSKWQRVLVYCAKQGIKATRALEQRWSREAKALSIQLGYEVREKEVQGKTWPTEKAYHIDILAQVCGKFPPKQSMQMSFLDDD